MRTRLVRIDPAEPDRRVVRTLAGILAADEDGLSDRDVLRPRGVLFSRRPFAASSV
jgi:hypothetical protein